MWHKEDAAEDRDLVRRCQCGDDTAFEELVRKYQQTLLNIIHHNIGRRCDVEDIAQKIFSKLYFSIPRFDLNRPFFPWLYRITINQCHDEMRRARRSRLMTFSELNLQDTNHIENLLKQENVREPSQEERKELHDLLFRMLDRLPEKQRQVLVLRELEDVPYEQMARLLNCTEQAARLKVFRARTRLRDLVLKDLRQQKTRVHRNPPSA